MMMSIQCILSWIDVERLGLLVDELQAQLVHDGIQNGTQRLQRLQRRKVVLLAQRSDASRRPFSLQCGHARDGGILTLSTETDPPGWQSYPASAAATSESKPCRPSSHRHGTVGGPDLSWFRMPFRWSKRFHPLCCWSLDFFCTPCSNKRVDSIVLLGPELADDERFVHGLFVALRSRRGSRT